MGGHLLAGPRPRGGPTGGVRPTGGGQPTGGVPPTGDDFLANPADRHPRPQGSLGDGMAHVAPDFDDTSWRALVLPHDYAIEGPFTDSVSANMGRLPATGVAWFRKTFTLPAEDAGQSFFIDIDGAMSYSMVWVNGQFVGGWPYGYASYRLEVTPYVDAGAENVIAVCLDHPVPSGTAWDQGSSRWYPGAGVYRDGWLVTTAPVHVAQWGTYVRTPEVSAGSATVELDVAVDNDSAQSVSVSVATDLYAVDDDGSRVGEAIATLAAMELPVSAGGSATAETRAPHRPRLAQPDGRNHRGGHRTGPSARRGHDHRVVTEPPRRPLSPLTLGQQAVSYPGPLEGRRHTLPRQPRHRLRDRRPVERHSVQGPSHTNRAPPEDRARTAPAAMARPRALDPRGGRRPRCRPRRGHCSPNRRRGRPRARRRRGGSPWPGSADS